MSSSRTYRDAIDHLNTLQVDAARPEATRATPGRSQFAISDMLEYLYRIGYSPNELNALNVIHIAGTKGKGSTSAFVNSILQHAQPSWKVGLYTSPHLSTVRERIRINGVPISEEDFTKYFFEVWDNLLMENDKVNADDRSKAVASHATTLPGTLSSTSLMPGYFRCMTLLAFHVFLKMKVDATVLEVGVGGAYDGTNIVPKPVVTGITALGIDHVPVLGNTLRDIAWHKGGIFKEGVPAITVVQPQEGMEVLEARARELRASSFRSVQTLDSLFEVPLGLAGRHQVQNATIAVELARQFLCERQALADTSELPQSFVDGLRATRWPGRCQTVADPAHSNIIWYLDGAHTLESLDYCMDWFLSPGVGVDTEGNPSPAKRVLIFNCTKGRPGETFIRVINNKITAWANKNARDASKFFDHVIFCTNATYANGRFKHEFTSKVMSGEELLHLTIQNELSTAWSSTIPEYARDRIHVLPSIEHAISQIRTISADSIPIKLLVTGSLHLIAGIIEGAGLSRIAL
ncbi:hypothetical protein D9756_000501 [Leucocoprinus leucothites]|uniref:Folylpolyglutamate synthase n=1 Tax=Leucocoprinus leucothites TaxID=201217 RepID=A0A8H5GES4_9AGAR|nr:hypothetical protein D9756_000501 [Leucoagaricus leucothites]